MQPPVVYPISPLSERIKVIEDIIILFESGHERMWHPNGQRRTKETLEPDGKRKYKEESDSDLKDRLANCKRISEGTLPQLRDVLATLNLLMYGD